MLANVWFQLFVVLAAIAIFVIMTIRGSSPIVAGLISTAIVSIVAIGGFTESLLGTFITGMTDMFGMFFILFSFGTAFGAVLHACGGADRLGVTIVRALGEKNFIYAIIIVGFLFGLVGAPPLAVMPALCFPILKKANLPRYIAMAAVGGSTAILNCVPGALGAGNVLSSAMLGTSLYAGSLIGVISTVVGVIALCIYVNKLIARCRKDLIGYDPQGTGMMGGEQREEDDMPRFVFPITSILIAFFGCAVLMLGFEWNTLLAVATSLTAGMLFLLLTCHKYLKEPILHSLRNAVDGVQINIVGAITVCGFAAVIANTELFGALLGSLSSLSINPYVLAVLGTFVIAALCADYLGGVAVTMQTLAPTLIAQGAAPAIIHRLVAVAASVFDSMPHGGSILLELGMFGYNHKQGYKYIVVVQIIIPLIYTVVALLCAMIIPA